MSARHFSSWDFINEDIIKHVPYRVDIKDLYTIVYVPEMVNSPKSVKDDLHTIMSAFNTLKGKSLYKEVPFNVRFENFVEMIIIDEADRLQPKTLEQIRAIYDKYEIALILIGMPGIEKRLIRFPQLYSRIGFAHAFKALSKEEISFIIKHYCNSLGVEVKFEDFMDQEAVSAVTRITQGFPFS